MTKVPLRVHKRLMARGNHVKSMTLKPIESIARAKLLAVVALAVLLAGSSAWGQQTTPTSLAAPSISYASGGKFFSPTPMQIIGYDSSTQLPCIVGYDATCSIPASASVPGTVTLGAGSAVIGKVGIDQTTPGTTNAVQAGSFTDRQTSTPTVQNTAYSSGNCVGGFNSVTFQGTGPINFLNDVRVVTQDAQTVALTVYVFDQNPSGSTCTDKGTFTLATADTAKLVMTPFQLTLAPVTGATQSFAANPNLARIPKSGTTTLWYGLVAGGTFTPGSTTDVLVGFQVVQQHQ